MVPDKRIVFSTSLLTSRLPNLQDYAAMALNKVTFTALALVSHIYAQQVGTNTPENHPALSYQRCTGSGCTSVNTAVVLDANWRWTHNVGGYTNCYTGNTWNSQLCPDTTTCANNCALEGANYQGTYGIQSSGDTLNLKFVTGSNVGYVQGRLHSNSYD